jgi:hypothetical protein
MDCGRSSLPGGGGGGASAVAGGSGTTGRGGGPGGTSGGAGGNGAGGTQGGASGTSTGGTSGGAGGTGTGGTSGGAGGAGGGGGDAAAVAAALDGQRWLVPSVACNSFTVFHCTNFSASNPGPLCNASSATPYLTRGTVNRDQSITLPGSPATTFRVSLRVRGVVETKAYINCSAVVGSGGVGYANGPAASGTAGCYPNTIDGANVYMMQVGDDATGQRYFLNASNQAQDQFSYPIDYTFDASMSGGTTVRFLASDSDCMMNRNCGTNSVVSTQNCMPNVLAGFSEPGIAQPYDGQFIVMHVVSVSAM